jgi:hypothetical protein
MPIFVNDSGKVIVLSDLQHSNETCPISTTELGITIDVSFSQP